MTFNTHDARGYTPAPGNSDDELPVELPEVSDCATLARYLQVDLKTVQGLAQRRELPGRKVGKAYRFFRPAVLAWLCEQTAPTSRRRR
jgi:excisionase family DNA binding protein